MRHYVRIITLATVFTVLAAVPALSAEDSDTYRADLRPLNDSGATGTAMVTVDGTTVTVEIEAEGLTPGLPHAQHIHGVVGDVSTCPGPEDDTDDDGFVSVTEGAPAYGGILVSLTTEGDTTPESGLAVDRMPVADDDGTVEYSRTFEVSEDVAASIGDFAIVQHGIDLSDTGEYSDDFGPSDIDPDLPFEATVPATCGTLGAVPVDGVAAGAGGTADGSSTAGYLTALLGSVLVLALAGGVLAHNRRATERA